MSRTNVPVLFAKTILRALPKPIGSVGFAVALASATILWNPLPLLLFAIAVAAWLFHAAGSPALKERAWADECSARRAAADARREASCRAIADALSRPPLASRVEDRTLPDYVAIYERLAAITRRVAAKGGSADVPESAMTEPASALLDAYLELATLRLSCAAALSAQEDGLASELRARLARLERGEGTQGEDEDAAATRKWHAGLLRRRLETIEEWRRRDELAAARLDAIPDLFEELAARVDAPELGAGAPADYDDVLARADDTARLLETLRAPSLRA